MQRKFHYITDPPHFLPPSVPKLCWIIHSTCRVIKSDPLLKISLIDNSIDCPCHTHYSSSIQVKLWCLHVILSKVKRRCWKIGGAPVLSFLCFLLKNQHPFSFIYKGFQNQIYTHLPYNFHEECLCLLWWYQNTEKEKKKMYIEIFFKYYFGN